MIKLPNFYANFINQIIHFTMSSSDDDTKNVAKALMNCKRPLSNSVCGGLKKKGGKVCNLCQLEKIPGFEDQLHIDL